MKTRIGLAALATFTLVTTLVAADEPPTKPIKLDPETDALVRESLPVCSDMKYSAETMQHKLPPNLKGAVIKVDSTSETCKGIYLSVTSTEGGFYLGLPWFLDDEKGSIEEKLKNFTWTQMQEIFTPVVGQTRTRDGLIPVTLIQTTERGKLPLEGEIDPAGTVFFFGTFRSAKKDIRTSRIESFEPFLGKSPSEGATRPEVTVVEFSDFECPSCKRASGFMQPILEKYPGKVRYIRYDLPLIALHPWALSAAIGGRAIFRQKPELFWEYKKQVYANQDSLSAFTIGDFARGFAQDHDLDLKKFDADFASDDIKEDLIKGAGVGLSNEIRATPTYMVNGTFVEPGPEGKALEGYVASQLK